MESMAGRKRITFFYVSGRLGQALLNDVHGTPIFTVWIFDTITGFSLARFLKEQKGMLLKSNHICNRLIKLA